jgi:DNA-binding response OmpR family regulator
VLVVEDDDTLSEVVAAYLTRAGLRVTRVADGIEVFRRLRSGRPELPVIMLTARGEEDDRILGLAMGADDYVTKPFSARELVLRVESVLRRASDVAFTRAALMREVWGWEFGDQSTVTVHVRRLRTKVEVDPGEPRRLTTVWGVGYRWESSA